MSPTDQILSHVEYVAGAATEKVGEVLHNSEWTQSGEAEKKQAVENMRAAHQSSAHSTEHDTMLGSLERKAGELTGCEGMAKDGSAREGFADAPTSSSATTTTVDETPASVASAAYDAQKLV